MSVFIFITLVLYRGSLSQKIDFVFHSENGLMHLGSKVSDNFRVFGDAPSVILQQLLKGFLRVQYRRLRPSQLMCGAPQNVLELAIRPIIRFLGFFQLRYITKLINVL